MFLKLFVTCCYSNLCAPWSDFEEIKDSSMYILKISHKELGFCFLKAFQNIFQTMFQ